MARALFLAVMVAVAGAMKGPSAVRPQEVRLPGLAVRGGAFDVAARETGELAGLTNPSVEVVRCIVKSATLTSRQLRKLGRRSKKEEQAGAAALAKGRYAANV